MAAIVGEVTRRLGPLANTTVYDKVTIVARFDVYLSYADLHH